MSFLFGLLLLLAPVYLTAEAQKVVFAQIENSVTLPRKSWGAKDKIHVNWFFNDILLITRNPTSSPSKIVPQEWQGRLSLSPDYSLIISPVLESDFGIFKCEQHELVDSTVTTYKLYHVTMFTPKPVLAGGNLFLDCKIEDKGFTLAKPSIKWFGPGNRNHTGSSTGNKHTLTVNNVSGSDSGKWICQVNNSHESIHHTLNAMTNVIIVDLAPSPYDPIYTCDSVTDFSIPCALASKIPWSIVNATGVTGGSWVFNAIPTSKSSVKLLELHPNPSPTWKVPSGTQSSLKETELKNHDLSVKISRVSVKDRGTYTCSLEFGLRKLSSRVQVEVLQVFSTPGKVIYEGNTVNLTCTLGHPMTSELEVNWIPPPAASLPTLSPTHPTELSISGVKVKDSGRWTCQLKKNSTVLTSATISLKVEKAPVNIWLVVAIVGGVLVFILLAVITVIIIRRRRQVMMYRRRKKRLCCCKNPKPRGFYKT